MGRLTLFPHNYDFSVVIGALTRLVESGIPVYSAYSSLSALSIATDYRLMDSMAESLLEVFELPEGHSPFRYEPSELDARLAGGKGRKIETIATYWEPVIKIYGSNLETGFTALTVSFSADDLPAVLAFLSECEAVESFKVIALNSVEQQSYTLVLLVGAADGARLVKGVRRRFSQGTGVALSEQSGLEVVYFHGPHFQDRYGVANAVVKTMETAGAECVLLNCSGTSIFLVTPAHGGGLAQKALEKVFTVP